MKPALRSICIKPRCDRIEGRTMKKKLIFILIIILSVPAVSFSDECVEGDCVNGKGTMVSSTGHKYTGEFKAVSRHGEGVMLMPGGRKLVSPWAGNEIREGRYTEPDGTVYEGQWEFRERNGQGTLTYPDGRNCVGEFKSGQRHGQGTMTWPDGRKYVGDFKQDAQDRSGHHDLSGWKNGEGGI